MTIGYVDFSFTSSKVFASFYVFTASCVLLYQILEYLMATLEDQATVLGLSYLISDHGFVHMMTVSAGICDESGGGAWSCKLSRGSRLARLRMGERS
ncbi:hypothetical protein DVH24_010301 [Malus domestica]|uniref:Uncharacterized protein n=1 Tax=Malus domestica TaxID=3750 RepID=A0A498JSF7_MALDO|nr:hypothetical protein DVH24_010301 [Malus domestica]